MSRPAPRASFARGAAPPPPRQLLPMSTFAPPQQASRAQGGLGPSSSSIYDNDDEVTQSLAEFLDGEEGGGDEGELGESDEFGWRGGSGDAFDTTEPFPSFRHRSPPSPSPTRASGYRATQLQPIVDRTTTYYATPTPSGQQRHPLPPPHQPSRTTAPPIRPMPLRLSQHPPSAHSNQPQQPPSAFPGSSVVHRPLARTSAPASASTSGSFGGQQRVAPGTTVGGRHAAQEMDVEEGEEARSASEDYWGEQDGGDGDFEQALARTRLDFGRGGGTGSGYDDGGPTWSAQPATSTGLRTSAYPPAPPLPSRYLNEPAPPLRTSTARPSTKPRGPSVGGDTIRKQGSKLRPVSELPDALRSLWRFGVFNAVQSVCFDTVYHTDQNVVVSAPTGAGKTVLFELAIVRLFTSSPSTDAKVLYMAPTKSLCSERTLDWKRKFEQGLGWAVQELTGDSDTSTSAWRDFANARIIVTTPEKWDAMTRKWHDHGSTLGRLRLFCVDEVHTVGADVRGAVLEVVVSRMKTLGTSTRFVAVSATVPNIHDVAEWLGTGAVGEDDHEPASVFQFGDEFRPCKLQKVVIGYPKNGNDFAFANGLNFKLFELVKQYSSGKPVLIFCNTRKGCLQAAEALAKDYKLALSSSSRQNLAWPKPHRSEFKTSDKHLAVLLENGIATHHAGMDSNDRRLVERLFIDGSISIVCSTSTLAVGVNLPARMVIIRGTKAFIDGQSKEYSDLEVLQMIGRAGRPQFDTTGIACIMTEKALEGKYSNLLNAQNLLESCLHKSLTEHVNSEITLRTIADVQSGLHWLRSTFLYVRITKNPAHYAIGPGKTSPETRLEEICLEAIKELVESGVVDQKEDELSATQFGDIMSKFYLSHQTFLSLKDMPLKSNMRTLLETLSASTEFSSYRFRQGEKSVLQKYNKNLKFPTAKVSSTADRIMILIQLVLDGVPGSELKNDSINPLLDARAIFNAAVRIAKCMVDLAVEREDGAIRTMLELLRSLNGRCWDGSSFVLRQLEGIGEKSYKILVSNGIKGFDDVRECEPDRLEVLLGRKPPYGRKLISQAKTLPQFEITMSALNEEVLAGRLGVQIDLSIDLRLTLTKPLPAVKKGPMKLWAYLATTTSDGEFIDFRRTRMDHLLKSPKQVDLSVVLLKPSQRIIVSASCDLIAGSDVKAVFKPETRASEFPIPSLGPTGDEEDEEQPTPKPRLKQQTLSTTAQHAQPNLGRASPQQHDGEVDEPVKPAPAPARRRPDGKFECNHSCGDKTVCKHLCCREGLDKPPTRRASSKKASSAAKHVKKVQQPKQLANPPSTKVGPPLRIQPTASMGVKLAKDASGKVVSTASRLVEPDEDDEDELPSLEQLLSTRRSKVITTTAPKVRNSAQVVPPAAMSDPLDEDDQLASSSSSPTPPPPPPVAAKQKVKVSTTARKRRLDSGDRGDSKRARISVREFASSSPIELPEADARPPAHLARRTTASTHDPLFRADSPREPPSSTLAQDDGGLVHGPPGDEQREPLVFYDDALQSDEEMDTVAQEVALEAQQVDEEMGEAEIEAPAVDEDEDDFDAWMASSVVIV
ncbi:hypothetical protein JCM9279_004624 [Rhodotorula babjevae]